MNKLVSFHFSERTEEHKCNKKLLITSQITDAPSVKPLLYGSFEYFYF